MIGVCIFKLSEHGTKEQYTAVENCSAIGVIHDKIESSEGRVKETGHSLKGYITIFLSSINTTEANKFVNWFAGWPGTSGKWFAKIVITLLHAMYRESIV